MSRGIMSMYERKTSRKSYIQTTTKKWMEWLGDNLTDQWETSSDVYRRGIRHNVELVDGFKSAIREMVRIGTIEIQNAPAGRGKDPKANRYMMRKPQPKPVVVPTQEAQAPMKQYVGSMDNCDGETYRGALWRKLEQIDHAIKQNTDALNALLLTFK